MTAEVSAAGLRREWDVLQMDHAAGHAFPEAGQSLNTKPPPLLMEQDGFLVEIRIHADCSRGWMGLMALALYGSQEALRGVHMDT